MQFSQNQNHQDRDFWRLLQLKGQLWIQVCRVTEDSVPVPPMNETDSAGEIETAESVLLCVAGFLNEFPVTFLVDSGATRLFC